MVGAKSDQLNKYQTYFDGLKAGSEKTFRQIMEYWYSGLLNFANGYLNDEENAREVVQDVFLQLWDNRKKLNQDTNLNAYLYTLTRNRCIDLIRRERLALQFRTDKKKEYEQLTESYNALSDPILDELFARELQSEIQNTIDSLPDQCQKVFRLSREKGLKNKEISEALHLSEKTVESHITKALKTLRNMLEQKYPGSVNLLMTFFRFSSFPSLH